MAVENLPITRVSTPDLESTIDTYVNELPFGYRLEMIKPADHPSEAWLSNGTSLVCLRERRLPIRSKKGGIHRAARPVITSEWHTGRAGMMYRDLIPERLGGKLIASHIRITDGGPVADYVHYHKVRFQMIYCIAGAIEVVYEDQGPPFTLLPGDCVLQPPEIRHRVLHAEAGSEVIELGMPAIHETWVEHEMTLPTAQTNPERVFNRQRFVRHIRHQKPDRKGGLYGQEMNLALPYGQASDICVRDTDIVDATDGFANVKAIELPQGGEIPSELLKHKEFAFCFVLSGGIICQTVEDGQLEFTAHEAFVLDRQQEVSITSLASAEILLAVV